MKDEYLKNFYKEIKQNFESEYRLIIEPGRDLVEDWIEYDSVKWEIEEPVKKLVDKLKLDSTLNFEQKLLEVYKYICLNYVYDDNVLFFFRKDLSDPENPIYIACDWYGRIIDDKWVEKRKKHNRRICYEFSRCFAKAINELIENDNELEACVLGLMDNTHYVVGLTGKEYSAVLDLDDFNKVKDLTRLKLGLSLDGINILRDENGKLKKVVDDYNNDKLKELPEITEAKQKLKNNDIKKYIEKTVEIFKSHHLDEQGFMECMKKIVEDEEIDPDKIWKEVKSTGEKRYVRCLIIDLDNKKYLIDSVDQTFSQIDLDKLDKNIFVLKPEEHEYPYFGG